MKRLSLFLLFLTIGLIATAQTKEEVRVIAAVEKLRLAMISGEKEALGDIVSADLSYGHSGGKIEDKTSFVEALSSGSSDFVSINLSKQTVKVTGKVAMVRHQLDAKTNDKGKPGEVKLGILLVWLKEGKQWKLLGRQAFKL
jgi:ketosteroid isomerase-like protein